MTRFLAFCFVVAVCLPAIAIQDGQVMYTGGTVPGLNSGVVGHLDMSSETSLIFEYPGARLAIPYAAMESFEYSDCRGCGKKIKDARTHCAKCAVGSATEWLIDAASSGRIAGHTAEAIAKEAKTQRQHA